MGQKRFALRQPLLARNDGWMGNCHFYLLAGAPNSVPLRRAAAVLSRRLPEPSRRATSRRRESHPAPAWPQSFRAERPSDGEVSRASGVAAFAGLASLWLDPPSWHRLLLPSRGRDEAASAKDSVWERKFCESFAGRQTSLGQRRSREPEERHETPCRAL